VNGPGSLFVGAGKVLERGFVWREFVSGVWLAAKEIWDENPKAQGSQKIGALDDLGVETKDVEYANDGLVFRMTDGVDLHVLEGLVSTLGLVVVGLDRGYSAAGLVWVREVGG
jgi:hypothetical protein